MKYPDLPKNIPIEIIVDEENYTVGYYVRGFWSRQSVAIAVEEEYAHEHEGFEHGYFRFTPEEGDPNTFMRIKQERIPKRGNFPVTYHWH